MFVWGKRRCSPALEKGIAVVQVDIDRSRGLQQARIAHSGTEPKWMQPMSSYNDGYIIGSFLQGSLVGEPRLNTRSN
jgi:hypothetical protein